MLHLELRVPPDLTDEVLELLCADDTVTNVAVVAGAYRKPTGAMISADVAREGANPVVASLQALDLHRTGSITMTEPLTTFSAAADEAERAAPGTPDDGVVWQAVESRMRSDSRLSWSFVAFLVLATLIAGAGRLLDQPILIIGAMVVGPEFSPIAAICFALARPRLDLLPTAATTLLTGFGVAVVVATPLWTLAHAIGLASRADAISGPQTDFIVQPDIWSFIIALLAGIAGVLALTSAKSGPLVGVFISVTTVPAVGTVALCLGVGEWGEIPGALLQLGANLAGMVLAGSLTLLVQRLLWSRVQGAARASGPPGPGPPARDDRPGGPGDHRARR